MSEKSTSDLCSELIGSASIDSYLSRNRCAFLDSSIADLLTSLYQDKSVSKAALARKAGMSEVYLHQVFSGRRNPSRDRLLCLCFGLDASLAETQQLLKQAGYAQLYPRSRRDAIILHGLTHGIDLSSVNDKLFAEGEKTLF